MAKAQSKLPAVTLVIEWENAIDVADEWTHRAMDALEREIEAVAPRMPVKPRIMYLYDATCRRARGDRPDTRANCASF
jgi:hypothetical protein